MTAEAANVDKNDVISSKKKFEVVKKIKPQMHFLKAISAITILTVAVILIGGLSVFNFFNANKLPQQESSSQEVSELMENYSRLDSSFKGIQAANSQLESLISNLPEQILSVRDDFNNLGMTTNNDLSVLKTEVSALQKSINDLGADISKLRLANSTKTQAIVKDKREVVFNLKVEGMGSWGKTTFLTVNHNGEYIMLEIGQALSGWELSEIDLSKRIATLNHQKSGKRVTIDV